MAGVEPERLFRDARPVLLRIALARGVESDSADDLVQETLTAAHRAFARFDPERGTFHGWLATILTRRWNNRRRDRARRMRFLTAWRREPRTDSSDLSAVEARLTLARLLERLSPRQREVVALYEIGQLSANEVATCLGLTAGGVRSIARDARRVLARAAGGLGPTENRP